MPVKRVHPVPSDIEIAQAAELLPIIDVARGLGLAEDDLDFFGKYRTWEMSKELFHL